ncbi:MAG: ABC transporter permease [Acidimicrobiales bacterium]|nr:ABC transporter permease [Acidimicrobiales bacterium]RZV47980.1 MAG: ABC transporter permease [Acidimicrobiales bacterium]
MTTLRNLPAWARWPLYVLAGILLLTIVQSISDTGRLTAVSTSREMLRWAVPIFLAGLGGLFSERAGVVNIGLEGMLILGMWFGAWGSITYGPWAGLAIGMIGGGLGGLLHAVATVTFNVDHIISGVAINILAPALTRYLSDELWASPTTSPRTQSVGDWDVPFLAGGTIFGWESPDLLKSIGDREWWYLSDIAELARGLLRGTHWVAIIALLLVPFTSWLIWRTRFGLRLRIAGENPQAGEAQGVDIIRYKYIGVIISGILAGLGGAFISTELSGLFQGGNSAGRGFIGLAALIFGNWRPGGVLVGALLFGYVFGLDLKDLDGTASHALLLVNTVALAGVAAWALSRRRTTDAILATILGVGALAWWLSAETVPNWWSNILPYVLVLLVLVFFAQRLRMPAADGLPYRKGES